MNAPAHVAGAAGGSSWISRRIESLRPPAGPLRRYAVIALVDATGTGLFAVLEATRCPARPGGHEPD